MVRTTALTLAEDVEKLTQGRNRLEAHLNAARLCEQEGEAKVAQTFSELEAAQAKARVKEVASKTAAASADILRLQEEHIVRDRLYEVQIQRQLEVAVTLRQRAQDEAAIAGQAVRSQQLEVEVQQRSLRKNIGERRCMS